MPAPEGDPRRARALIDLGRIDSALAEVRRILAGSPEDADALELLGLCLIRGGQAQEALGPLGQALAAAPDRAHLHYLRGFALGVLGDRQAAERALSEAVRLAPDEPVYLRALSEHHADLGHGDEALRLARQAVAADPERAANHRTLGYAASAAHDPALAQQCYERALALDPQDAIAWNNLGCVLMARGDRLGARERFREALRLDPGAERAGRNLALVAPQRPPDAVHRDFDALLGAAVRELYLAGRLGPSLRTAALALAVGRPALAHALRGPLERRGAPGRVAAAAGAAVAAVVVRRLRPSSLPGLGLWAALGGAGYFAAAHRVTPLRRRFVEQVGGARREWEATRKAWLDGKLSRAAREARVERQLERLAMALDADDDPPPVATVVAPADG